MTFHFKGSDGQSVSLRDAAGGDARIRDIDLANRLGFAQERDIRKIIERNQEELLSYAALTRHRGAPIRSGKGRVMEVQEYWLTEGQALVICALSRTPKAAAVRKLVIEVFVEWRREQERRTVHVREHNRKPPTPALPAPAANKIMHSFEIGFTADPEVMSVTARVPTSVAYDFMGAFAAYQQTVIAGMKMV